MFEPTDPVIRSIRAPFEEISATLGARIEEATAEFDRKIAEHERQAAETAEREAQMREQHAAPPAPDTGDPHRSGPSRTTPRRRVSTTPPG